MIARIRRCWRGSEKVTVILVEEGQVKETAAYLTLPTQDLQAQLCEQVESLFAKATAPRFVVQLAPPEQGQHHIELLEMIHEPRNLTSETDAIIAETERVLATQELQGSLAEIDMEIARHRGKQWHDI